jgi:hypothetical protein
MFNPMKDAFKKATKEKDNKGLTKLINDISNQQDKRAAEKRPKGKKKVNQRKIEVNRNGDWIPITFENLHKGDLFRMFESTGEPVIDDKGNTDFIAISEPYLSNNTLTINVKE